VNRAQRIVLVIAFGLAGVVVAIAANLVITDPPGSGWFPVSGSTGVTFSPSNSDDYFVVMSDRAIVEQAAVWLAAIAVWTAAACWLLRDRA
jgi:hypothetical protein